MKKGLLLFVFLAFSYWVWGQNDNVQFNNNSSIWWNSNNPWNYGASDNRDRPDNGSYSNLVNINTSGNYNMTLNENSTSNWYHLGSLSIGGTSGSDRTFDVSNCGGLSLNYVNTANNGKYCGLFNNSAHLITFNINIGCDTGLVYIGSYGGGTMAFTQNIYLNTNTLTFNGAGNCSVSGPISGSGNIVKSDSHYLTFSGTNTYSGTTTVNGGTLEITGSIDCGAVTVASGATLIVNGSTVKMSSLTNNGTVLVKSGHTLTVTNAITNNSGATITVEDTASVLQTAGSTNSNSNAGTINVYRKTTPYVQYDYTYWSSPIFAADLGSVFATNPSNRKYWFNTANYKDLVGASDPIGYGFPQNAGGADTFDDNNDAWTAASGAMTRGQGYIVQGTADDASTGQTVNFTASSDNGKFNNGDVSLSVVLDKWHADGESTYSTFNTNQNLIGNPYPSAVDLNAFLSDSDNSELSGTLYFWTHKTPINNSTTGPYDQNFTNNDYSTYTTSGGTASASGGAAPSRYLASGQGFFANVNSAGTIIFKNSHRVANENNHFLRTNNEQNRIWINFLPTNNDFRQILVGFIEGSSDEYNPYYDGQRMENGVGYDFYSYIPTQPEVRLAVNGLGTFEASKVVPLGLEIVENGTHQITLDHAEGIFTQGQKAYLKDNYTATIHDLSEGAYSFTQDVTDNLNNRFELIFALPLATDILNADSFAVYPNPSKGVFHINSKFNDAMQVQVTDVTGKLIGTYYFDSATQQTLDISGLQSGIYLAKISVKGNSVTKKLIVE